MEEVCYILSFDENASKQIAIGLSIILMCLAPSLAVAQGMIMAPSARESALRWAFGRVQSVRILPENPASIVGETDSLSEVLASVDDLQATGYSEGINFIYAVLAPARDKIAFSVHGGVRDMLGVLDLQRGRIGKVLEVFGGGIGEPVWDPQGQSLAVTLNRASGIDQIELIELISGDRPIQRIISREFLGKQINTFDPAWSQDGTQLFFSAKGEDGTSLGRWVIYRDGTGLSRLQ